MPSRTPGAFHVLTRPRMLLLHTAAVTAVVVAVLLGRWQMDAWQLHREDRAAEIADDDPVPLESVLGADDPFPGDGVGRSVSVTGTWRPAETVLVAGKEHEEAAGYWVVTPLAVCDDSCSLLPVVMGWTPSVESSRTRVVGATGDRVRVTGWLQPAESGTPDDDPTDDVLASLRVAELLQRFDQDVYGGYLILRSPAGARRGLAAVTPESLPDPPAFTALRNLLYGLEWWFFGLFAAFLWWRWSRDELEASRVRVRSLSGPAGEGEEEPAERLRSTS